MNSISKSIINLQKSNNELYNRILKLELQEPVIIPQNTETFSMIPQNTETFSMIFGGNQLHTQIFGNGANLIVNGRDSIETSPPWIPPESTEYLPKTHYVVPFNSKLVKITYSIHTVQQNVSTGNTISLYLYQNTDTPSVYVQTGISDISSAIQFDSVAINQNVPFIGGDMISINIRSPRGNADERSTFVVLYFEKT